jgi:hypothetical protein
MDVHEVVAESGAAWNENDESKRAAILERAWADDGVYRDPTVAPDGRIRRIVGLFGPFPSLEG